MRILHWKHFQPQTYWIADGGKTILLDYIARFEQYEQSYAYLKDKFGANQPLAHVNSGSHSGSYDELYSPEMREIVADLYSDDIKLLEYESSY